MLGFVFATKNEYNTFRLNITDVEENKLLGGAIIGSGMINSKKLCYALSGCGKVNAAIATTALIERYNPTGIVNVGLAGAVNYPKGTYYVKTSRQGDFDLKFLKEGFDPSEQLTPSESLILQTFPDMKGIDLITTDKFITDESLAIYAKFGSCLVDMEGAAINWVCECYNKNYYGIKIVSDGCNENEYKDSVVTEKITPAEIAIKLFKTYEKI